MFRLGGSAISEVRAVAYVVELRAGYIWAVRMAKALFEA